MTIIRKYRYENIVLRALSLLLLTLVRMYEALCNYRIFLVCLLTSISCGE